MYKVDIENKKLVKIPVTSFSALNLKERYDIQEWINGTPEILGEDLLVIAKEKNCRQVGALIYWRWTSRVHLLS